MKTDEVFALVNKATGLYKTVLKTTVNAQYGLHQIGEAIEFYLKNQTAGKVVIKPSLTAAGTKPGQKIDLNEFL